MSCTYLVAPLPYPAPRLDLGRWLCVAVLSNGLPFSGIHLEMRRTATSRLHVLLAYGQLPWSADAIVVIANRVPMSPFWGILWG